MMNINNLSAARAICNNSRYGGSSMLSAFFDFIFDVSMDIETWLDKKTRKEFKKGEPSKESWLNVVCLLISVIIAAVLLLSALSESQ